MNKDAAFYYEAMQARYAALSGCAPDPASDFSLRFHTLAEELAALDARLEEAGRQAFGGTATGAALDAHGAARGLLRREATCAVGTLEFTRAEGAPIGSVPAGSECAAADGTRYLTAEAAVFALGAQKAAAPAAAVRPGKSGNAAAGTVCKLLRLLEGINGVENPAPFLGGSEEEDDRSLSARLRQSYAEPANGANGAFYRQTAENRAGISSAAVTANGGAITVYVAAEGQTGVTPAVKTALQAELNARREPCVTVSVLDAQAVSVDLRVGVEPAPGVRPEAAAAALAPLLRQEVERLPIGGKLTRARLVQVVMESGLVGNCRVELPATDQGASAIQVLRPGTVSVTGMGAGA